MLLNVIPLMGYMSFANELLFDIDFGTLSDFVHFCSVPGITSLATCLNVCLDLVDV